DPSHRRLDDGVADAEQLGDPGRDSRYVGALAHSSSSAAACTAATIGVQSAPGSRVTVTKSFTPKRLTTPGAANTACANGVVASSREVMFIISASFTSSVNFMASGLGVGEGVAV